VGKKLPMKLELQNFSDNAKLSHPKLVLTLLTDTKRSNFKFATFFFFSMTVS
jgi:hypothetical protein